MEHSPSGGNGSVTVWQVRSQQNKITTLTSSSSLSLGFSSEVCLTKSGMRISSVARATKRKSLRWGLEPKGKSGMLPQPAVSYMLAPKLVTRSSNSTLKGRLGRGKRTAHPEEGTVRLEVLDTNFTKGRTHLCFNQIVAFKKKKKKAWQNLDPGRPDSRQLQTSRPQHMNSSYYEQLDGHIWGTLKEACIRQNKRVAPTWTGHNVL